MPANMPARRRRDSSDDFGAGSLGSIGGSLVGSSVASATSSKTPKTAQAMNTAKTPTTKNTAAAAANRKNSGETLDISVSSSLKAALANTTASPPISRRPFRRRKASVDFTLSIDDDHSVLKTDSNSMLPSTDALPSVGALDGPGSPLRLRSLSFASGLLSTGGASLEQLDALGEQAHEAAEKIKGDPIASRSRKGSISEFSKESNNSGSQGTNISQSHRFLLEAFMGGGSEDGNESLVDSKAAEKAETFEFKRERLGSIDGISLRDRLESFEGRRRERLESWGGMSDLSIPLHDSSTSDSLIGATGTSTAAALAATIYTTLANDVSAAALQDGGESVSSFLVSDEKIPAKVAPRERLNSIASYASISSFPEVPTDTEIPSDIQQFVKAAMASVNDQLVEIAVAATEAVKDTEDQSELSSTASPMLIGAASDTGSRVGSLSGRPRASSLSNNGLDITVDYNAVNAALNAAEAAAGAIDLAAMASATPQTSKQALKNKNASTAKRKRTVLPTKAKPSTQKNQQSSSTKQNPPKKPQHIEYPPIPKSKLNDRDMERIRERARAAAGYVPPSKQLSGEKPPLPFRKKAKLDLPATPALKPNMVYSTPRPGGSLKSTVSTPYTPALSTPGSAKTAASKGQSSQKWDSMFDCLVQFIDDRRKEETIGSSEDERKAWIWDGNVPTTYKTKDGKALGRWVNNQRSAKSKGVLKGDREKRLVDAGLKWSVLASNSWNEMLEELRIYVAEHTKTGRKWDGNVPTNYRIKTKTGACKDDEDKNLGRWVNRQRSLYQAGKLRKDRQTALEKVGLKWSMLATTSWESMYETLYDYVRHKTKDGAEWDGNVPANYRTMDNPPRALGRWINRQRSAYGKKKLKHEYTVKLNQIGLKWSVHERKPITPNPVPSAVPSAITITSSRPSAPGTPTVLTPARTATISTPATVPGASTAQTPASTLAQTPASTLATTPGTQAATPMTLATATPNQSATPTVGLETEPVPLEVPSTTFASGAVPLVLPSAAVASGATSVTSPSVPTSPSVLPPTTATAAASATSTPVAPSPAATSVAAASAATAASSTPVAPSSTVAASTAASSPLAAPSPVATPVVASTASVSTTTASSSPVAPSPTVAAPTAASSPTVPSQGEPATTASTTPDTASQVPSVTTASATSVASSQTTGAVPDSAPSSVEPPASASVATVAATESLAPSTKEDEKKESEPTATEEESQ